MLAFVACSDENDSVDAAPVEINSKALSIVSGTIVEIESEVEEGIAAWEVEIVTAGGAEVQVYCSQDNQELLRVDGEGPPFDYEVTPGNGLFNLSQALTATENDANGALEKWRLRPDDSFNNDWVYTFEFAGNKVTISATTGDVLKVE